MKKGGIGVGSASIVLVFAVLCLTVFSLISLSSAISDKEITDASIKMVTEYYDADTLAEYILSDILESENMPERIRGINITAFWDWDIAAEIVSYSCPVSDSRALFVELAIYDGSYDVLEWKLRDSSEWTETENMLDVWQG